MRIEERQCDECGKRYEVKVIPATMYEPMEVIEIEEHTQKECEARQSYQDLKRRLQKLYSISSEIEQDGVLLNEKEEELIHNLIKTYNELIDYYEDYEFDYDMSDIL